MSCPTSHASNRLQPERGRGTSINPANRFQPVTFEQDDEYESEAGKAKMKFLKDDSETILSKNDSPDIPFTYSLNPYRGCEHGCMYCYARPTHEYLGYSAGLDFETVIIVKENAPELLRKTFTKKSWTPEPVVMSGVTDPYQPVEKKLGITRKCLEVFAEFRNPVSIITKNHLVTRDLDLLSKLAEQNLVRVNISLTSLDPRVTATLEPRTSRPQRRLDAIKKLSDAGIPVGVMTAPVIPGLNDHEIPALLEAAAQAGAKRAGYVMLRLPWAVKEIFEDWLTHHYPDRKDKIMNRVLHVRNGKMYDADFSQRMKGSGEFAEQVKTLFAVSVKRYELQTNRSPMNTDAFTRNGQLSLF